MNAWDWIASVGGALLIFTMLVEVVVTVLHPDLDGAIVRAVHRIIWRALILTSRGFRRGRRALLALAGPIMMTATLLVWVGMFIVGFALIVWPHLDAEFLAAEELGRLDFVDALYFSGVTGTVSPPTRIALDALNELTDWRADEGARP
jgi:hypothetical protein